MSQRLKLQFEQSWWNLYGKKKIWKRWKFPRWYTIHTITQNGQLKKKTFFNFQHERHTEVFYPLIHCPNAHHSSGWARPEPEALTSTYVSPGGHQGLHHSSHPSMPPRVHMSKKPELATEPELKPGTPTSEMGVLGSTQAVSPNSGPYSCTFCCDEWKFTTWIQREELGVTAQACKSPSVFLKTIYYIYPQESQMIQTKKRRNRTLSGFLFASEFWVFLF